MKINKQRINQFNIIFIDQNVYDTLKMDGAHVLSIHHRTIHLLSGHHIITIGHDIGVQKHHIVLNTNTTDFKNHVFEHDVVTIHDNVIKIGQIKFLILKSAIKTAMPYQKTFKLQDIHLTRKEHLIEKIKSAHRYNLWQHEHSDIIAAQTFQKISAFQKHPESIDRAQVLLGLGIGLTPLGDDVLCGYIMGAQLIKKNIPWRVLILELSQHKTNHLSHQMIKDSLSQYYPAQWIEFSEDFFDESKELNIEHMLNIGATSGAAVLTGFIIALTKRGEA